MKKIIEFISMGFFTPIIYSIYAIVTILFTFLFGLPVAFGIYLIQMAMDLLIKGVF